MHLLSRVKNSVELALMESGVPAAKLCREHGMRSATLYKWRALLAAWTPEEPDAPQMHFSADPHARCAAT